MKAIKNVRIYDFETFHENAYVLFDESIVEVGSMNEFPTGEYNEIIDGNNALLLPGLVNGHSHIYSTFARGISVDFHPTSFRELLEQLWWKLDRYLDNDMTYYSGIVSAIEYAKNGVTTIIDHHASGEIRGSLNRLKDAFLQLPLRGVFCFETSDRFDVGDCITENIDFMEHNQGPYVAGMFGLHASFTLSDETLQQVHNKLGTYPIHIHVAESIEDQIHAEKTYQKRVINRLHDFQLIHPNSIITHGIYLEPEELQIIQQQEAVIALNVTSNMNNAVGLPNYQNMKEHNVTTIIGNDGIKQLMTTEFQNLYFAMHHQSKSPFSYGYDDLRNSINNTYALASKLLGVKLGKIKKGFVSDFVLLPYEEPTPLHKDNIFGHLLFGLFNSYRPRDVFVGGKRIITNYQIETVVQDEYNKAKKHAQTLWDRVQKEGNL